MSQVFLAELLGVGATTISNYENGSSNPEFNTLIEIAKIFGASIDRLLFTPLFASEEVNNLDAESPVSSLQYIHVPIMNIEAAASQQGILPQGHIEEKDVFSLPADLLPKGKTYISYPVRGESMFPTLVHGDYVLGAMVDVGNYSQIKNGLIYGIMTADKDFIIKRVRNMIASHGYLICLSDNHYYPSFNVRAEDILQVFEVVARLTFHFTGIPSYDRLERIEERLDHIDVKLEKFSK